MTKIEIVKMLVRSCFLITLIKCLKGHKSLEGHSVMSKVKASDWFLAVICRFLAVICGSLSVSVGSWRLYVGSWRSSAVPGGYLVLGVLLSCCGQLKTQL